MENLTDTEINNLSCDELKYIFVNLENEEADSNKNEILSKLMSRLKNEFGFSLEERKRLNSRRWSKFNKEYSKYYREENKEKIKQQQNTYYENNPDKLKEKRDKDKQLVECECGLYLTKKQLTAHKKTKLHLDYLDDKTSYRCECGTIINSKGKIKLTNHYNSKYHCKVMELKNNSI